MSDRIQYIHCGWGNTVVYGVPGMAETNEPTHVGYDSETNAYHAQHDWTGDESVSETVIRTVAVATDREPLALDPLYGVVDVDALDRIFKPYAGIDLRKDGGCLSFEFGECTVTVYWDGRIVAAPKGA